MMPGSVGMKLRNGVVFLVRENKSVRLVDEVVTKVNPRLTSYLPL